MLCDSVKSAFPLGIGPEIVSTKIYEEPTELWGEFSDSSSLGKARKILFRKLDQLPRSLPSARKRRRVTTAHKRQGLYFNNLLDYFILFFGWEVRPCNH